ncbi:MAG: hypothetical protein C0392_01600 [Syntrophus sp. (in: bacteria)]|nr:hypothetical protein [Syntrophus sp. (in: bacteria)]
MRSKTMRFSVCLIAPEGYRFSHFLYDSCKYFCYTIEAAGYECCMVRNKLYSDRINIIFGAHNLTDPTAIEQLKQAGKYVVMQSEVLSEKTINAWPVQESYSTVYLPILRQAEAVWESLESNKRQLKQFGIDAEMFPRVGYLSSMEEIVHKKKKDIDFLFYGSLTPHRKMMIDELKMRGGNVLCVFDDAAIFRNDLIARARINLAPNQARGTDHLSSRVLYLLNNRSIVVVERCYNQDWVEHCFLSADAEKWADLCMETIRRPDLDKLAEGFFEHYKKLDMVDLIRPLIDKLDIAGRASSNDDSKEIQRPEETKPDEDQHESLEKNMAKKLYEQAVLLHEKGKTALAIKQFEIILEIDKDNQETHNDIGVLYFQDNSIDKALHHLKIAVKLDPDKIDYRMNMAGVYLHTGEIDEAIGCYQDILERTPDNVEAALALARLCSEAGLKDTAVFYFSKVLEIEPNNTEAKQCMAEQ